MNHPEAAAILRTLTEQRRHELEAIYRSTLLDALDLPDEQWLWWADLTDPAVIADAVGRVEATGWLASVEALWLDLSLEHGFPSSTAQEQPEPEDD